MYLLYIFINIHMYIYIYRYTVNIYTHMYIHSIPVYYSVYDCIPLSSWLGTLVRKSPMWGIPSITGL